MARIGWVILAGTLSSALCRGAPPGAARFTRQARADPSLSAVTVDWRSRTVVDRAPDLGIGTEEVARWICKARARLGEPRPDALEDIRFDVLDTQTGVPLALAIDAEYGWLTLYAGSGDGRPGAVSDLLRWLDGAPSEDCEVRAAIMVSGRVMGVRHGEPFSRDGTNPETLAMHLGRVTRLAGIDMGAYTAVGDKRFTIDDTALYFWTRVLSSSERAQHADALPVLSDALRRWLARLAPSGMSAGALKATCRFFEEVLRQVPLSGARARDRALVRRARQRVCR